MNQSNRLLPMAGLLIGCVIFGLGSLIVAHVPIGSYAMAFWRLLVSSLIFVSLAKFFGHRFAIRRQAVCFALLSGVALGLDLALWHESIRAVGPGIATLLNSLQIFFLAFIGWLCFAEKQNKSQVVSLILAVLGVAFIASPEFAQNQLASWGFVWGILSGACLAISMVFIRQTHRHEEVPIFVLMSLIGVGGMLGVLPFMWWLDAGKILPTSWEQVGWILVYGSLMQCFAWGLIAYSIPRLSLALTGLLLLSEPVAALLIDYFWLHKSINIAQWAGVFLTMLAIYRGSLSR